MWCCVVCVCWCPLLLLLVLCGVYHRCCCLPAVLFCIYQFLCVDQLLFVCFCVLLCLVLLFYVLTRFSVCVYQWLLLCVGLGVFWGCVCCYPAAGQSRFLLNMQTITNRVLLLNGFAM